MAIDNHLELCLHLRRGDGVGAAGMVPLRGAHGSGQTHYEPPGCKLEKLCGINP